MNNVKNNENNNEDMTRAARLPNGKAQILPDEIVSLAEDVQIRVDQNFRNFLISNNIKNVEMIDKLSPIITDDQQMSKLKSGKIHVNMRICVALHYVYGVDLNEFIAGDISDSSPVPLEVKNAMETLNKYIGSCKTRY